MTRLLLCAWACSAPLQAGPTARYGVLLLAHGGGEAWNREIDAVRTELARRAPAEVALGMADPGAIQAAVERLQSRGAGKLVAVPLFVNSASEVLDETRYVLGLAEKPSQVLRDALAAAGGHHGHHGHRGSAPAGRRVKTTLPLVMTSALDDHPLAAEILLDRAKALSRDAARETVVLVGHGPVDDAAERAWRRTLENLGDSVRKAGGFKRVWGATLRDDAPPAVRGRAVAELRDKVFRAGIEGRALVIPYLIAPGGIEAKIPQALKGLPFAWDGRTICPHPNVVRWAAEAAASGSVKDDMRRFK